MMQQKRTTGIDVETALIDAAVRLTLASTGQAASDMAKNYKLFYETVVAAYQDTLSS